MPRQRLADNIQRIQSAAVQVFASKGYRRTRMQDVAEVAGMSAGALYRYVASKDALLLLVFSDDDRDGLNFPIPNPDRADLMTAIAERLLLLAGTPRLQAALRRRRPPADVADELRGVLEERYDLVASAWPLLAVVERSADDVPELFDLYFHGGRRELTEQVGTYLTRRASHGVRSLENARLAARFVEESLTWFAWHRHNDPDSADLGDDDARATAVNMNFNALFQPTSDEG